jgi:hypothetical protein
VFQLTRTVLCYARKSVKCLRFCQVSGKTHLVINAYFVCVLMSQDNIILKPTCFVYTSDFIPVLSSLLQLVLAFFPLRLLNSENFIICPN